MGTSPQTPSAPRRQQLAAKFKVDAILNGLLTSLAPRWMPGSSARDRHLRPCDPESPEAIYYSLGGAVIAVAPEYLATDAMSCLTTVCYALYGCSLSAWEDEPGRKWSEVAQLLKSASHARLNGLSKKATLHKNRGVNDAGIVGIDLHISEAVESIRARHLVLSEAA